MDSHCKCSRKFERGCKIASMMAGALETLMMIIIIMTVMAVIIALICFLFFSFFRGGGRAVIALVCSSAGSARHSLRDISRRPYVVCRLLNPLLPIGRFHVSE